MTVTEQTTIVMDLNVQDAIALVLEPAINYENVLQAGPLKPYKTYTNVKHKKKMLHLQKPKYTLGPKTGCKVWEPNVSFDFRSDEITVCDYEIMGEQCPDQFEEGCLRNLGDATSAVVNNPIVNAMEMAMAMTLSQSLSDDLYRCAWFGDRSMTKKRNLGMDIDLSELKGRERKNLLRMMRVCNGWWSELIAGAQQGTIKYVDTNNGSTSGNALNPANIERFLEAMLNRSHPILRSWNRGRANARRPIFFLQTGLYDMFIKWMQALGCQQDCRLIIEGTPVEGVYMWRGYNVVEVPEWEAWDFETGNLNENTGYSYNQRAIFTVPENLCIATGATANINGLPGSAIAMQTSPLLRDKGLKQLHACYSFGFGVAHNKLITVGYNSSRDYVGYTYPV